jgi:hypothetical protein
MIRTPLQEWATKRWQLAGNLEAAKSMILWHVTHTTLTAKEFHALNRILKEIKSIQNLMKRSNRITRDIVLKEVRDAKKNHNSSIRKL